jgi:hypothetical protein
MTSRLVNRDSVALGTGELYLADSATHIASTTRVLSGTDYFGAKTEVSVKVNREFAKNYEPSGNILMLMDHILTRLEVTIDIVFVEIYNKTLSFAMGGVGTDTDFFGPMLVKPVYSRAELVFTYPNKTNQMIIILPRVQIVNTDFDLTFQSEDSMKSPLTVKALRTTDSHWSTRPLGKCIFV